MSPTTSARDEAARRIRTLVAEGELEPALEQLRDLARGRATSPTRRSCCPGGSPG
jgi:hypothetical protein